MTKNDQQLAMARYELLQRLEDLFEIPLIIVGFVWLALLIVEVVYGASVLFETLGTVIWIIFLFDLAVKFLSHRKSCRS